jgi:SAM-dependent methyltransferase
MSGVTGASAWSGYWDGVADRRIFAVEAADYVRRLRAAVAIRPVDRVLDFGCGFGHVALLVAPQVAGLLVWDAAASMRRAALARLAHLSNVGVLDLSAGVPPAETGGFDLVLVNSTIQYMSPDELAHWLMSWRALLRPNGRVVVSDVPLPGASMVAELASLLLFALRHGVLFRVVWDGLEEFRRYARWRGPADLQRWEPQQLADLARAAGLVVEPLRRNLTHTPGRFAVVLRRR